MSWWFFVMVLLCHQGLLYFYCSLHMKILASGHFTKTLHNSVMDLIKMS